MKTITLGCFPPLYEIKDNGIVRIFYFNKQYTQVVSRFDLSMKEIKEDEEPRWSCNVIDLHDSDLFKMIKENPESLECQKRLLRERILGYDSSDHVNSFAIGGVNTWLDKATRVGLKLRFEAEQRLSKTETTLWQNGMQFPLPLVGDVTALDMLNSIELYASACYDVTQMHLANIVTLTSVKEVKEYDYTSGYPDKLSF